MRRWSRGKLVWVAAFCAVAAAVGTGAAVAALGNSNAVPTTVTVPTGPSPIGIHGVDGPGFTISLAFSDNNQTVATLNPGIYKFTIEDLSSIHNFHLTGPGVDMTTTVPETGSTVWTVPLQPGTYTFVCDPHATTMVGTFTVLGYGTVTQYPTPPKPVVKPKKKKKR